MVFREGQAPESKVPLDVNAPRKNRDVDIEEDELTLDIPKKVGESGIKQETRPGGIGRGL
jgi:hypothetical protein